MAGVISLHAEAPREFTEADSDFLVHAASLVAGAIENARLYEHTRRRLALVEGMADLARAVSAASTLDQLLPAVARRAQRLLGAAACEVTSSGADGALELGASAAGGARATGCRARPTWAWCSPAAGPTTATAAAWRSSSGATPPPRRWSRRWSRPTSCSASSRCASPATGPRRRGPRGGDLDRRPVRDRPREPAA